MSNVKEFHIVADLPWDWASELSAEDCSRIASLTLNPVVNITVHQEDRGYVPNEHGGQTHIYEVTISGTEAVAWPFLDALVDSLAALPHATVHSAEAWDLESGGERGEMLGTVKEGA